MRRRLSAFGLAVSLLVGVALCVMWARSYSVGDALTARRDGRFVRVFSSCGGICGDSTLLRPAVLRRPPRDRQFEYRRLLPEPVADVGSSVLTHHWHGLGFHYREAPSREARGSAESDWTLRVPYWPLVTLALAPWVLRLTRLGRGRRRLRQGLCPACGYDVRATPDRCPECGTVLS